MTTTDPSAIPEPDARPTPRERAIGPVLFPRLSADQYRARVWRYVYVLMRLVFVGLILGFFWWVGFSLGSLLVPLLGSFILAYLLDPMAKKIEQRGHSRTVASLVCLGSILLIMAVALLFLLPSAITQFSGWLDRLPQAIDTVTHTWIPWVMEQVQTRLPPSMRDSVTQSITQTVSALPGMVQHFGNWGLGAVSTTGHLLYLLLLLILFPLFTYYFLRYLPLLKDELVNWVPIRRREYTLAVLKRMNTAVSQWFRGQLIVAAIIGALYALGLGVVFGLFGIDYELGIAVGIAAGLTNIIPYAGMMLAIACTALVMLLSWPGWVGVLFIVGIFVVNHILEAYVIVPKVVGDLVDLNPIAVIILLLAGGELAGIWGVLIIIPITGALKVILPDLRLLYHQTTFYQGGEVLDHEHGTPASTPETNPTS